jgi:hypothetical protein
MKEKNVQFKLSIKKYEKAKEKLQAHGLTWQKVCEQMSDHIIYSESLDEFGIPLNEMSPSIRQKVTSQLEGHIETALWKYIQIQVQPGRNRNHWLSGLQAALKQLLKSNSVKTFKRGYMFDEDALSGFLDAMWNDAIFLAAGHLGVERSTIKVKKPTLQELFEFAGVKQVQRP